MKRFTKFLLSTLIATGTLITNVYGGEHWYVDATVDGSAGKYSDSILRDDFYSAGAILNIDYLDNYSFALAYNNLNIKYKDAGSGAFNINQDAFAGRFQYYFYNDSLAGKITTQLVAHRIINNSPTEFVGNVTIIAPKLAYMHYDKDLAVDFEYVWSGYANNNLVIQQFAPSIGFGFNQNSDWLEFKAYVITSNDKSQSHGEGSFTSARIKWKHWLDPDAIFGVNNFFIDALAGQRVFAVDNEAFTVYNLEDIQQESIALGFGWRPGEEFDISAVAGIEKYKNKIIDNTYNREYLYISLTKHW